MAIYYVDSAATGAANGTTKADAYTTLAAAFTARAAGDTFYLSHTHAETQASAMTITSKGTLASPSFVYSVDFAGSTPPVSADLLAGASITTTGANAMTIAGTGATYYDGIIFQCGSGAVSSILTISAAYVIFQNCQLAKLGTTGTAFAITFSGINGVLMVNTTVKFGAVSDSMRVITYVTWRDTAAAIDGTFLPTSLLQTNVAGVFSLEGVDLSALGSGKTLIPAVVNNFIVRIKDCQLGALVTVAATPANQYVDVTTSRTDSAGTNYISQKYHYAGTQLDETVIVRTGGASDGTTALSRKITTNANTKWAFPFEATPLAIWQDSTAAATATIEFITNAATLPLNDEIWFVLEYLGATTSPLGSYATGTKADGLATGSALTASTQAWDSLVTARANSTTYAVNDVRKVASNSGRLFIVTAQTSASAASEPAAFATAVDGDAITDGGVTWRCMMRFKQTLNFTAAQKGYVYAYAKVGKASTTYYIDPLITLA